MLISSCNNQGEHLLSTHELEELRQEFNLPKDKTFKLDKSYLRYLFTLDTSLLADQIKNHYQPIQAAYYDRSGKLVSFHINCYASEGDEDFNWNKANAFASFVPKSVAPLDDILFLNKHLLFIKTFANEAIDTTGFSAFDYTVIVHWNKKLHPAGARKLIKIVQDNAALIKDGTINIIYVNNDDLW